MNKSHHSIVGCVLIAACISGCAPAPTATPVSLAAAAPPISAVVPQAADLLNDAVVEAPMLDADGRFSDYLPIAELAPRTGYIIRLGP